MKPLNEQTQKLAETKNDPVIHFEKKGPPLWLITVAILTALAVFGLGIWLISSIKNDFNRPWWVWALLVLAVAVFAWLSRRKTKQGDISFKSRKIPIEMLWSFLAILIIVSVFIVWGPPWKYWHDLVPRAERKVTERVVTTSMVEIDPDIHWGTNYLEPGRKHFFNRYETFYPRAVSTAYWGDTLHFKKKGFEKSVYWDLVFDEKDGTPRRVNDHDDGSNGDFYIVVNKQIIVHIRNY